MRNAHVGHDLKIAEKYDQIFILVLFQILMKKKKTNKRWTNICSQHAPEPRNNLVGFQLYYFSNFIMVSTK